MDKFKLWLENKQFNGITPSDIDWWARYSANLTFKTQEEAREWVFRKREYSDRQPHASMFGGIDGPQFNQAFANAIPLYQSGKSWKIGKRIRKKPFSWDDVEIRPNSLEDLETAGYVNAFDGPKLGSVQLIPIRKIHKVENHTEKPSGQENIAWLANRIKNGEGYFKAIVYDEEGNIIDGHHRYETAKLLKMTKVPAQQISFD